MYNMLEIGIKFWIYVFDYIDIAMGLRVKLGLIIWSIIKGSKV